jgi:MYXO-CTERM domain-containing protein
MPLPNDLSAPALTADDAAAADSGLADGDASARSTQTSAPGINLAGGGPPDCSAASAPSHGSPVVLAALGAALLVRVCRRYRSAGSGRL